MKCPNCSDRTSIDIDMHSEGFTSDESPVKECSTCGLVWRIKIEGGEAKLDIIKPADKKN